MSSLVSVIIPAYNRAQTLPKAINSVFGQTYTNWELIIVNDASKDNTDSVVEKYRDIRVRYFVNSENKGANYCRNLGAQYAQGDYLAFLDSDNYWLPEKLEKEMEVIKGNEKTIVFCQTQMSGAGNTNISATVYFKENDFAKLLTERNVIDTSSALIFYRDFEEIGGFDEKMPRLQDWEFFFRAVNLYHYKVKFLKECLSVNIRQENSISVNNYKYIDAILYFYKKYKNTFFDENWLYRQLYGKVKIEYNKDEAIYAEQRLFEIMKEQDLNQTEGIHKVWKIYTDKLCDKQKQFSILYQWKLLSSKNLIQDYMKRFFKGNGGVAIYGLGEWGILLYEELMQLGIHVVYGIDRGVFSFYSLPVYKPDEPLQKVDYIIVTPIRALNEIKAQMEEKKIGKVVTIEEIVNQGIKGYCD